MDEFTKTLERAIRLSNRAAGRDDRKSQQAQDEAARLLLELTRRLKGRSPAERWNVRRHYYRAKGQYLRVVALGHAEIKRGNRSGVMSIGFGHLDHAGELWRKARFHQAIRHAEQAEKAFKKILRLEAPKPNRCLAYALSLAMQGKFQSAEIATNDAKRLGASPAELRQQQQWMKKIRQYFVQSLAE